MIKIQCKCGSSYKLKDKYRGKTVKCKNCGKPLKIQDSSEDDQSDNSDQPSPPPAKETKVLSMDNIEDHSSSNKVSESFRTPQSDSKKQQDTPKKGPTSPKSSGAKNKKTPPGKSTRGKRSRNKKSNKKKKGGEQQKRKRPSDSSRNKPVSRRGSTKKQTGDQSSRTSAFSSSSQGRTTKEKRQKDESVTGQTEQKPAESSLSGAAKTFGALNLTEVILFMIFSSILFGVGQISRQLPQFTDWIERKQTSYMDAEGYILQTNKQSSSNGKNTSSVRTFKHKDTGKVKELPSLSLDPLHQTADTYGNLLFRAGLIGLVISLIKLLSLLLFYSRMLVGYSALKWFCGVEGVIFITLGVFAFLMFNSSGEVQTEKIAFFIQNIVTPTNFLIISGILGIFNLISFFVLNFTVDESLFH